MLGTFTGPRMVTPCATTVSPARVSSQLPPRSAARSTITEPGFMPATISPVTRTGALRPGTLAVVITTSLLGHRRRHQLALAAVEGLVLRAGVAARVLRVGRVEGQLDELRAQALHLLLDRRPHVVGRHDRADAPGGGDGLQPRHARRPRSARGPGVMVPAAVIIMGNILGSVDAASSTAV